MSLPPSSALSDKEPLITPSSKHAQAGTTTTRRKLIPIFTISSLKKCDYDTIMEHPHNDPKDAVAVLFGSDFCQWFDCNPSLLDQTLIKVGEFAREGLPLNCLVLCRNISPHAEDAMDLQMSALRTMGSGLELWKLAFEKGQVSMTLYGRKSMEMQLLKKMPLWKGDPVVTWRDVRRRSFVVVAPITAIWPLPITVGPRMEHSTLWSFTVIKNRDQWNVLAAIKNTLTKLVHGLHDPSN